MIGKRQRLKPVDVTPEELRDCLNEFFDYKQDRDLWSFLVRVKKKHLLENLSKKVYSRHDGVSCFDHWFS